MSNPGKNPVDTLRQEILADAGRQAERCRKLFRRRYADAARVLAAPRCGVVEAQAFCCSTLCISAKRLRSTARIGIKVSEKY